MQDLKALLTEEMILLKKLYALLIEEKEALSNNLTDGLQSISEEKNKVLLQLKALEPTRIAALEVENLSMMTLLKNEHNHSLKALIEAFIELTQKCAEQNLINGAVIAHNLSQISRFKQVIQGQNPNHQTYDTQGRLK